MLPKVYIPQLIERWDPTHERMAPAYDFTDAATYGTLTPVLSREDNPLFIPLVVSKAKAVLKHYTPDDYFVAVGDPSIIAICSSLIFRQVDCLKMLKWDRKRNGYIVLEVTL
jgi:hypothetical protein